MNDFRNLRVIGSEMPYVFATLYSIFVSKTNEYEVIIDDNKVVSGKLAEVFIGNGCVFGGKFFYAENTCVNDGRAIYSIAENKQGFGLLRNLMLLMKKKYAEYEKVMICGECQKVTIRRIDGSLFSINQDGDLIKNVDVCEAEIVHKGLKLVVPKGVRL